MPLRQHQVRAAEQFVKHCTDTGMLLWHRMGTGKTSTALATLMNYPHDRVLLLLPPQLKEVWQQEMQQMFHGEQLPFQLHVVDYDTLLNKGRNKHVQQQVDDAVKRATLVVADEAHHLVQMSKLATRLLAGKRCLLITGTPIYHALTDLAVLVNLAAGQHVLPYSERALKQLVENGGVYPLIKNYVQFYDFAADSNAAVVYPVVRVVNVTMAANHLPVPKKGSIVYSQHKDKLRAMATQLQRARTPTLYLQHQDRAMLQDFATGNYVLLLDPALAEGVTIPNATVLHVMEPVNTFGLQQQLYARVKRPVGVTAHAARPVHTIYQYMQKNQRVDDTLANLVRQLRQQLAKQQTREPTCGVQVRACDVWQSPTNPGTCA